MTSIDFKFFIENDSNPFVLFSSEGKLKYLNNSAEILMGSCHPKELFKLALSYAPKSFGYNKTVLDLSFGSFEFYGINVLYENENIIGMHLYNKPMAKVDDSSLLEGYTLTNLNLLLQANIELFDIHYQGKIKLLTDYDIPELQVHQNDFSMLLRHIFAQFSENKKLEIIMKIKLGERIVVKERRYSIIVLQIKSEKRESTQDKEIELISLKNHINIHFKKCATILEIPAIY
jgi:hemerythrin